MRDGANLWRQHTSGFGRSQGEPVNKEENTLLSLPYLENFRDNKVQKSSLHENPHSLAEQYHGRTKYYIDNARVLHDSYDSVWEDMFATLSMLLMKKIFFISTT